MQTMEMQKIFKKEGINPLKNMLPMTLQVICFLVDVGR